MTKKICKSRRARASLRQAGLNAGLRAGVVALAVLMAEPAAAQCLSGGEARQVVASGQAQPLGAISSQIPGKIVRAELCQSGGRLVYELSVMSGNQVRRITVDARSGAVLR